MSVLLAEPRTTEAEAPEPFSKWESEADTADGKIPVGVRVSLDGVELRVGWLVAVLPLDKATRMAHALDSAQRTLATIDVARRILESAEARGAPDWEIPSPRGRAETT